MVLVRLIWYIYFLISSESLGSANVYEYTNYQGSVECTASVSPEHPRTLKDLQDIVQFAFNSKLHVKPVGSLHSMSDCVCTDGILVHMKSIKHFSYDPETTYVTAGAGMELHEFAELLHDHGRALTCLPTYGRVTLGGAIGTGTHGTNLKHVASIADQLVSVTFVDGVGNVRTLSEDDDDFKAIRVNLGLLGIVYEVTLRTIEQYKIETTNFPVSDSILFKEDSQEILRIAETNDFFQFYWYPTNKQVVLSIGNRVPVNVSGNCKTYLESEASAFTTNTVAVTLELMQRTSDHIGFFHVQSYSKLGSFMKVPGRSPIYSEMDGSSPCLPGAVGYSHRMQVGVCRQCGWEPQLFPFHPEEVALAIDLNELPRAIKTMNEIMKDNLLAFPLIGILFRFTKESDAYMSVSGGRKSVIIELVTVARFDKTKAKLGIAGFQAIGQALIERHGGRSHWGKHGLYYTSPKILQRAYPQLPNFVDVMKRMDPDEVFLNDLGRRIKYGENAMTMSKAATVACALNEACVCQRDEDCGGGGGPGRIKGQFGYHCGEYMEFKVCKMRKGSAGELKEVMARNVISLEVWKMRNIRNVLKVLKSRKGFNSLFNHHTL